VFTGHQGLGLQLVDELGDETTARAWLAREKGVSEDLKVRTWRTGQRSSEFGWLSGAIGGLAGALGLPQLGAILSQATGAALERAQLDGLLALWHPQIDR
jgi:protease-4